MPTIKDTLNNIDKLTLAEQESLYVRIVASPSLLLPTPLFLAQENISTVLKNGQDKVNSKAETSTKEFGDIKWRHLSWASLLQTGRCSQ